MQKHDEQKKSNYRRNHVQLNNNILPVFQAFETKSKNIVDLQK